MCKLVESSTVANKRYRLKFASLKSVKLHPIHTRIQINPIDSINPGFWCRDLFSFPSLLTKQN